MTKKQIEQLEDSYSDSLKKIVNLRNEIAGIIENRDKYKHRLEFYESRKLFIYLKLLIDDKTRAIWWRNKKNKIKRAIIKIANKERE